MAFGIVFVALAAVAHSLSILLGIHVLHPAGATYPISLLIVTFPDVVAVCGNVTFMVLAAITLAT